MWRNSFSALGGAGLALGLFWLLALLVMPPSADTQTPDEAMTLSITRAPPQQQSKSSSVETPPEPVESAAPPPPAPTPSPAASSAIALPETPLPEARAEEVALDSRLPELTEARPEPKPEPEPEPKPQPKSAPEPDTEPAPEVSPDPAPSRAEAESAALAEAESSNPAANEPVNVGQATPTSRVNPTYPSRAQRRGMEGFVEVSFIIRRDGRVEPGSIDVTRARPRRMFDKAAREAIRQWQFEPSERRRRATQRIQFQLR
ncbi:energy transducer TonB [Halomonas piscis]|uniref:energy transducer TonB n=1 Tax=Halomonas piscis TaxID=3031727 RepID=UPI00289694B7|nr:TonB family protein [Halomonas piscis]